MILQERIKQAVKEAGDACSFSNKYSGRGMYGKQCVGVTGERSDCMNVIAHVLGTMTQDVFDAAINCSDSAKDAAYDLNDEVQLHIDTLLAFKSDSMGDDIIVYFPTLEPIPATEGGEDDN